MYDKLIKGRCIDYHFAALFWMYEFEREKKQRNGMSYACTLYLSESYILYEIWIGFFFLPVLENFTDLLTIMHLHVIIFDKMLQRLELWMVYIGCFFNKKLNVVWSWVENQSIYWYKSANKRYYQPRPLLQECTMYQRGGAHPPIPLSQTSSYPSSPPSKP